MAGAVLGLAGLQAAEGSGMSAGEELGSKWGKKRAGGQAAFWLRGTRPQRPQGTVSRQ